ncbi:DUF2169 domain-containing protein [Variovorax robiniae]|uniref:DUF2169 domain-containing protein n=1 Tax=Variovorax robiniae TaxID=1836199 RepID=A0ABU8XDV8_9BURK
MSVLVNQTGFQGEMLPAQDADGRFRLVVVIKATCLVDLQGNVSLAPEQDAVTLADVFLGEPGRSSVVAASDAALYKAATDIGLVGHAHAMAGTAATRMPVTLTVGPVRKRLLVIGDRVWERGLGGLSISEAQPFTRMPLVYERAFGGSAEETEEERNPAGVGFHVDAPDSGSPLPNIEDPSHLISSWSDRPAPQGFGFVPGNWQPRKSFVGTYDEAWKEEQFPLPPHDFDHRYFQASHPDLRCSPYLQGDEAVELVGVSPHGPLRFSLPGKALALSVQFRIGEPQRRLAALDTLTFMPDDNKFHMVWRHPIQCPAKILDVETVTAFPIRLSTLQRLSHAPR